MDVEGGWFRRLFVFPLRVILRRIFSLHGKEKPLAASHYA
jgi:hypothetical protein